MKTLIFDLDDTLIDETVAVAVSVLATARIAAERFGADAARLGQEMLAHAEELWRAAPTSDYCERMGIASWEGLTSDFYEFRPAYRDSNLEYLQSWAPSFRREAWLRALRDQGVEDGMAARDLSEAFREDRFNSHRPREGAHELLDELAARGHPLALLTNGPDDLQDQKLVTSGLKRHFAPENTFVSGYLGLGKPNLDLFRMVLEELSVEPREAVMIGDSVRNDIEPALACGLHAIWMRNHRPDSLCPAAVPRVDRLEDVPAVIESLEVARA